MPASMLDELARHNDPAVREAVADNINTPIDTLWMLAVDPCVDVRYAIAENHNVPLAILSYLTDDDNPYVSCRARGTLDRLLGGAILSNKYWFAGRDESDYELEDRAG